MQDADATWEEERRFVLSIINKDLMMGTNILSDDVDINILRDPPKDPGASNILLNLDIPVETPHTDENLLSISGGDIPEGTFFSGKTH